MSSYVFPSKTRASIDKHGHVKNSFDNKNQTNYPDLRYCIESLVSKHMA